jgi:hypothetical protein
MRTIQASRANTDVWRQNDVPSKTTRDFTILCPAVAENSGVIEALYALYYLPRNYKLMISATGAKSKEMYRKVRELIRKESLTDRVILTEQTGLSGMASPFSHADVVVYGNSDPAYTQEAAQSIVVFDVGSKLPGAEGQHNFAVATTAPEALASAILTVARNQRQAAA